MPLVHAFPLRSWILDIARQPIGEELDSSAHASSILSYHLGLTRCQPPNLRSHSRSLTFKLHPSTDPDGSREVYLWYLQAAVATGVLNCSAGSPSRRLDSCFLSQRLPSSSFSKARFKRLAQVEDIDIPLTLRFLEFDPEFWRRDNFIHLSRVPPVPDPILIRFPSVRV